MILGRAICYLLRRFGGSHRWRRLRISETADLIGRDGLRICARCKVTRAVKVRKAKV